MLEVEEALEIAKSFLPEVEAICDIKTIEDEFIFSEDLIKSPDEENRGIDVGDAGSIAGALITLFIWIDQIRRGNIHKKSSAEDIVHDLSKRVLKNQSLSEENKTKLIEKALEFYDNKENLKVD